MHEYLSKVGQAFEILKELDVVQHAPEPEKGETVVDIKIAARRVVDEIVNLRRKCGEYVETSVATRELLNSICEFLGDEDPHPLLRLSKLEAGDVRQFETRIFDRLKRLRDEVLKIEPVPAYPQPLDEGLPRVGHMARASEILDCVHEHFLCLVKNEPRDLPESLQVAIALILKRYEKDDATVDEGRRSVREVMGAELKRLRREAAEWKEAFFALSRANGTKEVHFNPQISIRREDTDPIWTCLERLQYPRKGVVVDLPAWVEWIPTTKMLRCMICGVAAEVSGTDYDKPEAFIGFHDASHRQEGALLENGSFAVASSFGERDTALNLQRARDILDKARTGAAQGVKEVLAPLVEKGST